MDTAKNSVKNNSAETLSKLSINHFLFEKDFRLIIANSPEEKQRAFLLRHQVFNEELHYNIGDKTSSTIEKDSHDQHSLLCLLQHRESGMDAGCLRVVIIDETKTDLPKNLPLEEYCIDSLKNPKLHPQSLSKNTICEVSRLAVHPSFRRKAKTLFIPNHSKDEQSKTVTPNQSLISLSLFLAATALVGITQRKHVFAMLEPRFNRLLKASGLHFQQVGEVINYCGNRAAFYIDQQKAVENLPKQLVPLYSHIEKELSHQMKAHEEIYRLTS